MEQRITWIVIDYMRDEVDVKIGNKYVFFSAPRFCFPCTGSRSKTMLLLVSEIKKRGLFFFFLFEKSSAEKSGCFKRLEHQITNECSWWIVVVDHKTRKQLIEWKESMLHQREDIFWLKAVTTFP
jgi:hypothetical protein